VVLFALTVHEVAHAWVADKCGDPTARLEGRITLNPLPHLDPIGTICIMFGPIGWAKPVPVNPYNLRNPRRDDILVSAAGPAANFLMAIACAFIFRLLVVFANGAMPTQESNFLLWFALHLSYQGIEVACCLAIFNLIPIFPLDGSHVLKGLLPTDLAIKFEGLNPIMPIVLLALVLSGMLGPILLPPIQFLVSLLTG